MRAFFTGLPALVLFSCAPGSGPPNRPISDGGPDAGMCSGAGVICANGGREAVTCDASGNPTTRYDCGAAGLSCTPGVGCTTCRPGTQTCSGNTPQACRQDGSGWDLGTPCDSAAGLNCDVGTGACVNLCQVAATANSYIACDYWATPTVNLVAEQFEYAVVVSNPQAVAATVTVTRAGTTVTSATVQAGAVETLRLPWIHELKEPIIAGSGTTADVTKSVLVRSGAYHVVSSVPVTVYQFNALDYKLTGDCTDPDAPDQPGDNQCFSFSNDASLLLPTNVLTGNYMILSYPHRQSKVRVRNPITGELVRDPPIGGPPLEVYSGTPGYAAIVGAENGVNVSVRFSAHVEASMDGAVSRFTPGQTGMFTLNAGDVLQLVTADPPHNCETDTPEDEKQGLCGLGVPCTLLYSYCEVGREYDLTGTVVTASGKVSVLAGHECAFVPYNRWACDHLEEALIPLEAWGKDFIVPRTQPLKSEPNFVRIVSGADGNSVSFDPDVRSEVTLAKGESIEFSFSQDFRVTGSGPLLVGQFLVGQAYEGLQSIGPMDSGDPSMSLAVPTEQFRDQYAFLVPSTYDRSFVNVVAPAGVEVLLDGYPVGGWTSVSSSGMQSSRVETSGGAHAMSGSGSFGVSVYGFGSFTSYMYPVGLDLNRINIF